MTESMHTKKLDQYAKGHHWLRTFPMWDWVGGRTSLMSAVGLVPARLQGLDVDGFLAGAELSDLLLHLRVLADGLLRLIDLLLELLESALASVSDSLTAALDGAAADFERELNLSF